MRMDDLPGKPEQGHAQCPADNIHCIGKAESVRGRSRNLIHHLWPHRAQPRLPIETQHAVGYNSARNEHVVVQLVDFGGWRERNKRVDQDGRCNDLQSVDWRVHTV